MLRKNVVKLAIIFIATLSMPEIMAKKTNNSTNSNGSNFKTLEVSGKLKCSNITADILKVKGSLNAKELILAKLTVDGDLEAKDVSADNIKANGKCILTNTKTLKLTVDGDLEVKDSTLSVINFKGKQCSVRNSTIHAINILDCNNKSFFDFSDKDVQILKLENTNITGDIVFDKAGGKIYLKMSKITGKVVNATIVNND